MVPLGRYGWVETSCPSPLLPAPPGLAYFLCSSVGLLLWLLVLLVFPWSAPAGFLFFLWLSIAWLFFVCPNDCLLVWGFHLPCKPVGNGLLFVDLNGSSGGNLVSGSPSAGGVVMPSGPPVCG